MNRTIAWIIALPICRLFLAFVVAGVSAANAEPFFLRYDAVSSYPEDQGWARSLNDPDGAIVRSLVNGAMRIDTTNSLLISDRYSITRDSLIPGTGEYLDVSWKVQTLFSSGNYGESEVSLRVLNSSLEYVSLQIGRDFVAEDRYLFGYPELIHAIAPDAPHQYRLTSADMQNYEFFVDGDLTFSGEFHYQGLGIGPRISWGDPLIGGVSSVADWNFVQVSVVPEPAMGALLAMAALLVKRGN